MHYALIRPTGYGDGNAVAVDTSSADAAMMTASTSDSAGADNMTVGKLFFTSVAAGVTVWTITRFLTKMFE